MEDRSNRPALAAWVESAPTEESRIALARLLNVTSATLERRAQLETALSSRIVIEQAKGVLLERFKFSTPDTAFKLLRRSARSHQMPLRELAAAVVHARETPGEILDTLSALRAPRAARPKGRDRQ